MLDKLTAISKLLVVPGAILYLFGFICVSAYLSRFGIISFDIINARYAIAGIYPLLCLFVAFVIASQIWGFVYSDTNFFARRVKERTLFYIRTLFSFIMASGVISYVLSFRYYQQALNEHSLHFNPAFGDGDPALRAINAIFPETAHGVSFILAWSIYIFIYGTLSFFAIQLFLFIIGVIPKRSVQAPLPAPTTAKSLPDTGGRTTNTTSLRNRVARSKYVLDVLFISIFVAFSIYSYQRLRISLVDYTSLEANVPMPQGLVLAWLYSTTVTLYVFATLGGRPQQFWPNIFSTISNPISLSQLIQMGLAPLLLSIFLFGAAIFPRIPYAIGGGQPRPVILKTKADVGINVDSAFFLIGDNTNFVFLVEYARERPRSLQVNKDSIQFIESLTLARPQDATSPPVPLPSAAPQTSTISPEPLLRTQTTPHTELPQADIQKEAFAPSDHPSQSAEEDKEGRPAR